MNHTVSRAHRLLGYLSMGAMVATLAVATPSNATANSTPKLAPKSISAHQLAFTLSAANDNRDLTQLAEQLQERGKIYPGNRPVGVNPVTSIVPPGTMLDYQGWLAAAEEMSRQRSRSKIFQSAQAKVRSATNAPLVIPETEARGKRGDNDTTASSQSLDGFGAAENPQAVVKGYQSSAKYPKQVPFLGARSEPDNGPRKAHQIRFSGKGFAVASTVRKEGSLDFYRFEVKSPSTIQVRIRTLKGTLLPYFMLVPPPGGSGGMDSTLTGWDKDVTVSAYADMPGTYYLVVGGAGLFVGKGAKGANEDGFRQTVGKYRLETKLAEPDFDTYSVNLNAGDVLAGSVSRGGRISVLGNDGTETLTSIFDLSSAYPVASPLPGGDGDPLFSYVARTTGTYYVQVGTGRGSYDTQLEVYPYAGSRAAQEQTIFLDTDGARLNTRIFGGEKGVVTLSPLSAFLKKWGLPESNEAALVDLLKANLEENLKADLVAAGISDQVKLTVVSSSDGVDLTGKTGVTTLVIGGTIKESGLQTIGIAESIDPGNFAQTETGVVLLDILSSKGRKFGDASLNTYLSTGSNRLEFVAQALGNVTSHEVGHMLGNWHTFNANKQDSIMDAGGNFPQLFGVGPDRIGGTADDRDVDFVPDEYEFSEVFQGVEDTTARSAWGLSHP
jgi:hypothetical protein